MGKGFRAERAQLGDNWGPVTSQDNANPFLTEAYVRATEHIGEPWKLAVFDDTNEIATATVGYLRRGRLERSLVIMSLPELEDVDTFWSGVRKFCTEMGVMRLQVNTFATPTMSIPSIGIDMVRRLRREFVLALAADGRPLQLSSNHRRSVRKALRAGITIRQKTDTSACEAHARLIGASLSRRKNRGEQVSLGSGAPRFHRFLEAGAGVIYQACEGDQVLSSILILLAERGAYYHSAGTSEEGMSKGASAFLINELATRLSADGFTTFNLGGADEGQDGLARFKLGFGSRIVELEAAECFLGSQLRKSVTSAIRLLRDEPLRFLKELVGDVETYVVYLSSPSAVRASEKITGLRFRKLTGEELLAAAEGRGEFRHSRTVYKRGFNDAYGVYVEKKLVHIGWLVTYEHDRMNPERNVRLRRGEAECTHLATLSGYRRRGIAANSLACMAREAERAGVARLYYICPTTNLPSRRCAQSVGFTSRGRIYRWRIRWGPRWSLLLRLY